MELDFWMNKIQDRTQEVCCTKSFIVSVMSLHVYFDKQVHKKTGKKIKQAKKKKKKGNKSLNFTESNVH